MWRAICKINLFLFLFLISCTAAKAQEIKVSGGFLKDSIRIGEPIEYTLSVSYPQQLTVLFPDSVFAFSPFEFTSKKFRPTHTQNGISHDSVIYYLTTFEIDKIQKLSLPVFVTTAKDCTQYFAPADSVYLVELTKNIPLDSITAQNLPLKTNTFYEKVFSQFNYVVVLIIATVIVIAALITWIFFGKKIIRYFKKKKLIKNHQQFIYTFTSQVNQLASHFSQQQAEQTVSFWKKYMEQLEQKPYTKLTTRETIAMLKDRELEKNLQLLDRAIYGNQTQVIDPLNNLQEAAEFHFNKKLEEVSNG